MELNGLKVYGEEINQALAYAEALCRAAGSQLTPLFQQLMDGQVSFRYDAHDLHYYEDGGVDCTIRGATVAMGSAYFMKKRRITLPHDLKMDTGVFMSVDGRLAAIFVVKYLPSRNVEWAGALRRNRVTPVLATRGVNITPNMLKRKFRLNARPIYPGVATRLALAEPYRPAWGGPQCHHLPGRSAAHGGNRHRQPAHVSGGALVHGARLDRRTVRPGAVVLSHHGR